MGSHNRRKPGQYPPGSPDSGCPGVDGNTAQVVIPPNSHDWHTNMLIVTTRRLYNVELNVIDEKSSQQPAFQVSYRYPDEAHEKSGREVTTKAREREQKQQQADIQQALNAAQTPRNWDYLKYPGSNSTRIVPTSPMTMVALRSWASPQPNPFPL